MKTDILNTHIYFMHLKGIIITFLASKECYECLHLYRNCIFDGINQASDLAGDKNASLNDSKITSNYS